MHLEFKIKEAIVLTGNGTDIIMLTLDKNHHSSAFPNMGYQTIIKIECQAKYGKQYCKKEIGIEPEIINIGH